ncbi:MAG: hypothetical protein WEA99_03280 [Brumimicrobium sp.]
MENKFEQYLRLSQPKNYRDSLEAYQMVLDSGLYISQAVHKSLPKKDRDEFINDALILFQMTMAKGIAVLNIAKPINYYNSLGDMTLPDFVDPMAISALIRPQYEAFTNFNNIFNSTENEDARQFLYDVWVIAGLKERRRFYVEPSDEELEKMPATRRKTALERKEKAQNELKIIESLSEKVRKSSFYVDLDDKKRKNMDDNLKRRVFQFALSNGKMVKKSWLEMFLNTGASEVFKPMYSLMSTTNHPSNVSVFQYAQMFDKYENIQSAQTLLKMSEKIMCFFIADYCRYIPKAKEEYQNLPEMNKVIIETANKYMRDFDFKLSDTLDKFSEEIELFMRDKFHGD